VIDKEDMMAPILLQRMLIVARLPSLKKKTKVVASSFRGWTPLPRTLPWCITALRSTSSFRQPVVDAKEPKNHAQIILEKTTKDKDDEVGGGGNDAAAAVTTLAAEEALKASITANIMAKVDALAMSDDYLESIRTNANALWSCIVKIKTIQEDIERGYFLRNNKPIPLEMDN